MFVCANAAFAGPDHMRSKESANARTAIETTSIGRARDGGLGLYADFCRAAANP
jgi:hypothetical protein